MALLEVKGLRTCFRVRNGMPLDVVRGVDLSVNEGEIVGLVGESGSGKTITALSITRLLPFSAYVRSGRILYEGKDLLKLSKDEMARIRGSKIAMIFQEPDLNPIMTVESQLREVMPRATRRGMTELLERVGIHDPQQRLKGYPFEFSGGMKQRVMIAMMALARAPKLLIADEPTTALDVTVQAQILDLLEKIVRENNMGMLLITHNLALVAEHADRVVVMRDGEIVESDRCGDFFKNPKHPYSRALLEAVPRIDEYRSHATLPKENAQTVLELERFSVGFPIHKGLGVFRKQVGSVHAVDGVDVSVREGETLGIIGESGCGKTTLCRAILRLIPKDDIEREGRIMVYDNNAPVDIYSIPKKSLNRLRERVQVVFQEAQDALNPRRSTGDLVVEGLLIHNKMRASERDSKAKELFELVGLDPEAIDRFPSQFSSGQRQRITIARALALQPKILILDEPVASLDVLVQKEVVDLLLRLKEKFGLTYIIVSHDLALIKDIAQRIAVMYLGKIVEIAPSQELTGNPLHPYTRALISAVPIPDPVKARSRRRIILEGEIPSPSNIPTGCRFRTRCPYAKDLCAREQPEFREVIPGHFVACHYAEEIDEIFKQRSD
ncbi:MAG: ABC transporter ATP-binding protein [Candidatus Spechtbacterales bacterium]